MRVKVGLISVMIAVAVPWSARADFISKYYYVPVVARNAGAAGSNWRTELCISNPHGTTLTVEVYLHQGGDAGSYTVGVPAGRVVCNDDFILDWFGLTEFQGGLSAWAYPAENAEIEWAVYPLSVRVYNQTADGTYGLSVTPVPLLAIDGELSDQYMVSGVRNFGTAGVDGFRTSIGIFNAGLEPREISMGVVDGVGEVVWSRVETIPPKSQRQYLLPSSTTVTAGTVFFTDRSDSEIPWEVFPYATVTDNETGDGRYLGAAQVWEGDLAGP